MKKNEGKVSNVGLKVFNKLSKSVRESGCSLSEAYEAS